MTIICAEPTADGNNYFLAEDVKAAMLYTRVTDIVCGDPGEVDMWGGWMIDMSFEDLDENWEFVEGTTLEDLVAAAINIGAQQATSASCKELLVEDDPDYPDGGFDAGEAWAELVE